jgi:hypothetical protein
LNYLFTFLRIKSWGVLGLRKLGLRQALSVKLLRVKLHLRHIYFKTLSEKNLLLATVFLSLLKQEKNSVVYKVMQ